MASLIVEFLFAVVFVHALQAYLRRRDEVQRAVMLMFLAMAGLFALDLVRHAGINPPDAVLDIAAALILIQPYLALRLIGRLRALPRGLRPVALVAYLVTFAPRLFLVRPLPHWVTIGSLTVFLLTTVAATAFLLGEAQARTGSPRIRLSLAAIATALMGLAQALVFSGGLISGLPGGFTVAGRAVFVCSAVTFVMAFMPPRWLRRIWSNGAAYTVSRRLLYASRDEQPEATWCRYAQTVQELAGSDGVGVLVADENDALIELASVNLPAQGPDGYRLADLEALLRSRQPVSCRPYRRDAEDGHSPGTPVLAVRYAHRNGAQYLRAVEIPLPSGRLGALLLVNRYRDLFAEDDAQVLAELGQQAAVLAERSDLTAALEASALAARAASQAKSDFLASMSHELRTPLNAVIGFSDLMGGEPQVDGCHLVPADWIENVLSSGQHLLQLVNDILDIAKVEAGRLELHEQQIPLRRAVSEVTATLRPLVERKQLRLVTAVAPLTICADPLRLRQILDNLLSNAIKYTPVDGQITIEAVRDGNVCQLSVADTGVGISTEDLPRIFDEFQQVGEETAKHGGTGLGLALTRRLIEAHGGDIDVWSKLGEGTRFTVRLPGPVTDQAPAELPPPAAAGLLIIEDDDHASDLLRTYLEAAGYRVSVAATGEAGLAAARSHRPDAIMLDIHLPGMDGWQVLQILQQDQGLRDVPAFIISVLDEGAAGRALGATDYFVKPVDRRRLLARLAEHVLTTGPVPVPPQVLLVDSDAVWLAAVAADLRRSGALVTTADRADHALELARGRVFDLVVTDLTMPDKDGCELIRMLRADAPRDNLPILVMTGHDLTDAERASLDGKVLTVLTKDSHACEELRTLLRRMTIGGRPELADAGVRTDPEPAQ